MNKKLVILDLGGIFFLQFRRNVVLGYNVHQMYSEVRQQNSALFIYQDPETVVFLNQILSVPGMSVLIWSPKHDSNAQQLIDNIDSSRINGRIGFIGREMCKHHPTVQHGVVKRLDDVWQSAGLNEFGEFGERNTVIVDCTRTVVECNPSNNVIIATPMNTQRYRGDHYLTSVLITEIDKKFSTLDHLFNNSQTNHS